MSDSDLEKRLEQLEQRLTLIEQGQKEKKGMAGNKNSVAVEKSVLPTSWSDLGEVVHVDALTYREDTFGSTKQSREEEISKSGNWLGVIAAVCFISAAAFIIKLSVDTGWLDPERQVLMAGLFGGVLIAAGFFLRKASYDYASMLPACGVIILYCAAYAGYSRYNLYSIETALLLANAVSAVCLWLYWHFRHDLYACFAVIGSYLAPLALNFGEVSLFTLYYFLGCSLAFAVIAISARSRTMTILSAYLAILSTFIQGLQLHQDGLLAIALAMQFFIFAAGTYLFSICNNKPLTECEAWSFFPVLILFYALEYYLIDNVQPGLAPGWSLLFTGVLILLYVLGRSWFVDAIDASQGIIYAFASLVLLHSVYLELMPELLKPWLFVLILMVVALTPKSCVDKEATQKNLYIPILIVSIIAVLEYYSIIRGLVVNKGDFLSGLVALAAFASIWFAISMHREDAYKQEEYGATLLTLAHFIAIVALYRFVDSYGSLAVSCLWLLYALTVLGIAHHYKDKLMAHSALLVLGFSAGKALLYDAAMTPTAVRILCLLLTGVALYGAGFLMKKIARWES